MSVIGTRPQFIKVAAISASIPADIEHVIVDTGQHYDAELSSTFVRELHISPPIWNLQVSQKNPALQVSQIIEKLVPVINEFKPEHVLVYGDTNSTLAGAIASVKSKIKLSHIEAGLRSGNKSMSEEQNRIIVDQISDLLFVPHQRAIENLYLENIKTNSFVVGDLALETFRKIANISKNQSDSEPFILATIHRSENTDNSKRLSDIFSKLNKSKLRIKLFAHPRLKAKLHDFDIVVPSNIELSSPISYASFIVQMKNASGIITDSGGIQKEAYMLGIPTLTVRDETEWTETIKSGWNTLDPNLNLIEHEWWTSKPKSLDPTIFGPLNTSKLILETIRNF